VSAYHSYARLKSSLVILGLTETLSQSSAPVGARGMALGVRYNRTSFPTIVKAFRQRTWAVCHCPDVLKRA